MILFLPTNLYLVGHLARYVNLLIYPWPCCIHCWGIEKLKSFAYIIFCGIVWPGRYSNVNTRPTGFRNLYANKKIYLQSHFCKRLTQSDNSFELSDCDRYWGSLSCFMCTSLHILSDLDILLLQLHSCGFCETGMTSWSTVLYISTVTISLHFRDTTFV